MNAAEIGGRRRCPGGGAVHSKNSSRFYMTTA